MTAPTTKHATVYAPLLILDVPLAHRGTFAVEDSKGERIADCVNRSTAAALVATVNSYASLKGGDISAMMARLTNAEAESAALRASLAEAEAHAERLATAAETAALFMRDAANGDTDGDEDLWNEGGAGHEAIARCHAALAAWKERGK